MRICRLSDSSRFDRTLTAASCGAGSRTMVAARGSPTILAAHPASPDGIALPEFAPVNDPPARLQSSPPCSACSNKRSSGVSRPITWTSSLRKHCNRPSQRHARRRLIHGSLWMGACSASVSRMVRISRIGTFSSRDFAALYAGVVSVTMRGTRSSVNFGISRATRSTAVAPPDDQTALRHAG